MRVIVVRTRPGESLSMDIYANRLVSRLKDIRPHWEIKEIMPVPLNADTNSWTASIRKYWDRFYQYPSSVLKEDADIFHIVDHSYGHLAYWLRHKTGKIIVTCHDLINYRKPENLHRQSRQPFISMLAWRFSVNGLRHADHIIADSDSTTDDLKVFLGIDSHHVQVVPLAVSSVFQVIDSNEVDSFRLQLGIPSDAVCLLYVGSVQIRKNVLSILKAVNILKSCGTPVHLLVAGENFSSNQRTFIDSHQLEDNIIHLGQLDHQSLVPVYNAADVFVFPSLYEGFGMPVLEAMACGTPVVTSNVSSLPEVAGDAAILVEPTNIEAIAASILRLQQDNVYREQLVYEGLSRAKLFTWKGTAEKTATVYEKAIQREI